MRYGGFYNGIDTNWGEPSRGQRLQWLISGRAIWDDLPRSAKRGANDLAEVVNYITSHDVADFNAMRFMNYLFGGPSPSAGWAQTRSTWFATFPITWIAKAMP